jgi:hypothetical protein
VQVRLLDDDTFEPIRESVTDADVRFQFLGLTAGNYTLDFSAEGRKNQKTKPLRLTL